MSDEPKTEEAKTTWKLLAQQVQAFVAAWDAGGTAPDLTGFVPRESPTIRRLVLVELIKVDLEYRWLRSQGPRRVEDYLRDFPELADNGIPCDLLYEEFRVRLQTGEVITPQDYFERFPRQATELGRLFGRNAPRQTTTLMPPHDQHGEVQPGDTLDDFDLLTGLGKGAFAQVFLARQRSLQRLVALKISTVRGAEPQTLAQMDHPYIVRVFDQRYLADRGLCLLYMQYVPAGTLQNVLEYMRRLPAIKRTGRSYLEAVDLVLRQRGENPPEASNLREILAGKSWPATVCWIGTCLAQALDYAHRQGILHRDIKPANVLITAEGTPKLADFNVGCSTKLDGAGPAAFFGGTLAYMSPEHLEAFSPAFPRQPDSLDGRSDLYSLGVLLWELLTGSRPFAESPLTTNWSAIIAELLVQRRQGVSGTSRIRLPADLPGLDQALLTCLASEPEQRFATGATLARALDLCLHPHAFQLLHPPTGSWRHQVRRWPILTLLLVSLVPNILAGIFNFVYNQDAIVANFPDAQTVFWNIQLAINGIVFPVGLLLFYFLLRPVADTIEKVRLGQTLAAGVPTALRWRCLGLGHYAAAISISGWLLAGIAYPLAMGLTMRGMPWPAALHFMASLTLCGLIAVAYPFLGVSFLTVRVLYPTLLSNGSRDTADDAGELARLARLCWVYFVLAVAVPMLAMLVLALTGLENRFVLAMLSAGGLAGLALAFYLMRATHTDLQALHYVIRPLGMGHDTPPEESN